MNYIEAVNRACEHDTLPQALAFIAIWETTRIVNQALENTKNDFRDPNTGALYDSSFEFLFKEVIKEFEDVQWKKKTEDVISFCKKSPVIDGLFSSRKINTYYFVVKEHGSFSSIHYNCLLSLEDKYPNIEFCTRAHQGRNIEKMNLGDLVWMRKGKLNV